MNKRGIIVRLAVIILASALFYCLSRITDIFFSRDFWLTLLSASISLLGFSITAYSLLLSLFYGFRIKSLEIVKSAKFYVNIYKIFLEAIAISLTLFLYSLFALVFISKYSQTIVMEIFVSLGVALLVYLAILYAYITWLLWYVIKFITIEKKQH